MNAGSAGSAENAGIGCTSRTSVGGDQAFPALTHGSSVTFTEVNPEITMSMPF